MVMAFVGVALMFGGFILTLFEDNPKLWKQKSFWLEIIGLLVIGIGVYNLL